MRTLQAALQYRFHDAALLRLALTHPSTKEEELSARRGHDDKGLLQAYTQANGLGLPEYAVLSETGPAHDRHFQSEVRIGGSAIAMGEGATKKAAEQAAARAALEIIDADQA